MADNVCPQTHSSVGAPCCVQLPRKNVARSGGLGIDIDATNPSNYTKNSKKSSNASTTPVQTTSPIEDYYD